MEYINKNNSLESAKNRLDISGLTYVDETKYVYDRTVDETVDDIYKEYIPLVKNGTNYILRYKNLMKQYYWLINNFIPSCSYEKLCIRNGNKTWIKYDNIGDALREEVTFNYYDGNALIATVTIVKGSKANRFTPIKTGYDFINWYTDPEGGTIFDFENTEVLENTNVYARYNLKRITVTFILNNGEPNVVMTVNYGATPTIADPEKTGYTFIGWEPTIIPAIEDKTYTAKYTTNLYIIRFFNIINPDDILGQILQPIHSGEQVDRTKYEIIETETIEYGGSSEYYETHPSYEHFICDIDWIDEDGNAIPTSDFTNITKDIDAYPRLTPKEYSVTFLDWDNTPISEEGFTNPQIVTYMDDATPPTNPSRPNYTFVGWDKPYTEITHDTILHAKYLGDELLVEYVLPSGDTYMLHYSAYTEYYTSAPTINRPTTEEYDPYTYGVFDGWYADSAYTEDWNSSKLLTEDTVIYGKWKNEFAVTFYSWDNTIVTGCTEEFENPVYVSPYGGEVSDEALVNIITCMKDKPNYEFLGWDKSTTGITYDTKITAVFNDTRTCVVTFIDGLTGYNISAITVSYGATIYESDYPTPPENEHYTFNGWDGNTTEITRNMSVYATYKADEIEVNFVDFNDNILATTLVPYNSTGETPYVYVPDIQAFLDNEHPEILSTLRFNGKFCYTESISGVCYTVEEIPITMDNPTFKAQYNVVSEQAVTCLVKFYNSDSTYWFQDEVLYGTVLDREYSENIINEFTDAGYGKDPEVYEFYGWVDENGNEYIDGVNDLRITTNISLTLVYRMISHTVRFYVQSNPDYYPDNVDLPINSLTRDVLNNYPVNRPNCALVPERAYFQTFCDGTNNKWYKEEACINEWKFSTDIQGTPIQDPDLVTEDIILYGRFIGLTYAITYNANGGSGAPSTPQEYRYPSPTERPDDPTKADGTFIGWYLDNETFQHEYVFGEPLHENITLYAKWFSAPSENTIIYNSLIDLRYTESLQTVDSKNLLIEQCVYNYGNGDGVLVYDGVITKISRNNFLNVTSLRSITIPSQLENVEDSAFSTCSNLTEFKGESHYGESFSLYTIDGVLFNNMETISVLEAYPIGNTRKDYTIPTTYRLYVNSYAFSNCSYIENITIGGSESIGSYAFNNCRNIKSITCKNSRPPSLGLNVFDNVPRSAKLYVPCQSYNAYLNASQWNEFNIECFGTILYLSDDSTVAITDNVLTMELISDIYSDTLVSVEIGPNVTLIDGSTFYDCTLLSSVTFGNNVTRINYSAFNGCTSLVSIDIPDSVTYIDAMAFGWLPSLEHLTIGNGVKTIEYLAFSNCPNLTELYLPYNIAYIGRRAFFDCNGLMSITCDRLVPPTIEENVFNATNDCPIYVPCDSVNDYKTAWSEYESRITCQVPITGTILYLSDNSTVVINDTTLTKELISDQYRGTLVAAEISDEVEDIDDKTFENCYHLTGVTIPTSVVSIGEYAFNYCTSLVGIVIPNSVTSIGSRAFSNCFHLSSVTLSNSITIINEFTFSNCNQLNGITIPNGVTSVNRYAFYGCDNLSTVNMPNSLATIEEYAFSDCGNLNNITIPSSVTYLKRAAFGNLNSPIYVRCLGITPPNAVGAFENTSISSSYLYIPDGAIQYYQVAPWSNFGHIQFLQQ